ncbi:uroporphyrinogen decarboxylase [Aestuariibaculum lutulentum]|uniref:Uroporphyrinogen decarboxylase n=1 Tax=Aestuariibaculum lutulentum TaxID=2920935 RepID=A0ABS9REH5_9FLAO|nr:uroporphyrinogen decarboxylase [Aestuariibaculum lutulentum]MCH4551356.1 uroporphyrinogen decarboxylase [Aestuariibaculum lutulentum]
MDFLGVSFTEWVGYAAMAMLLLSFTMKAVTKLRIVNSIGCLLFVIYGFMLDPIAKPIIITNGAILCVNLYYLLKK